MAKTKSTDVPDDVTAALLAAVHGVASTPSAIVDESPIAQAIPAQQLESKDVDRSTRIRVDALGGLTKRLGARFWRLNPVYDWARWHDTRRMVFTREYFEVCVIVDVFAADGAAVKTEVERKALMISVENDQRKSKKQAPLGYLPVVRGALVSDDQIAAVLRGETVDLCNERSLSAMRP